ncbi:polysaccharide deacetylase family protein [Pedobacter nutrimenti]|jgi:peptidoglycan/xylan/chitin deacetylase (PgdA/CDA1 family)|uniref:Peptidoglycan/xylan/chitin deacetylase (PgdA/CDA1 family) n=1 Tax=Pedobacter nutrimenti TaxID=1241337 RepID=A0A318UG65_9SPHI|nr:polysaccharide deacetylase family protein [Pedobacter nutrimenti]PYF70864.1 peptidoglycan/xylan/chitin deacetylase (PgdA/CDA1 family) [Pedobacter nutrimenti]
MYLVKSPLLLKWYYPSLVWNKTRSDKVIYLTFDDGPIPDVTDFVLKTLKSFNAKATFFCIGDNIMKHPAVFKRLKEEGHSIGNHTFNHLKGWKTENEAYVQNFSKCQELTATKLFRPPYGRIKKSQVKAIRKLMPDVQIIMWDVLSGDFDLKLDPHTCFTNVIKHTVNGSIVVFHDSLKAFERLEYTLPRALQYFSEQGYSFKAL